jgi:hypothetical protein
MWQFKMVFPQNMANLVQFFFNRSFVKVTALFSLSPRARISPQKKTLGFMTLQQAEKLRL